MGAFNKHEILQGNPSLIPDIAAEIEKEFTSEGYEVAFSDLVSGGVDISLTKGGMFKAVLGMKTALKITLVPQTDGIIFDANVGIFGQQVIPAIISFFFLWPVLITQIWGLVDQSNLDDKVLDVARRVIYNGGRTDTHQSVKFCTVCGTPIPSPETRFCVNCGTRL